MKTHNYVKDYWLILFFPTIYLCEARFSSYTSTKITWNTEADMRIHSYVKPDIK